MTSFGTGIDTPTISRQLKLKLAIIALVPTLILLDSVIAAARGWPFGRLGLGVATSATVALLFLILAAASRSGRSFLQNYGESVVYVVYSAMGAWLVAEVIVAVVTSYISYYGSANFQPPPHIHRRPPDTRLIFRPDGAALPGIGGVSHYTTNSKGIRGPEFPPRESAYRILAIGGSTTECTYLDDTETWPQLVMVRLNQKKGWPAVWVGNAGISGYPTVYHLEFVKESPLMKEVDALLFLVGANEFIPFLRGQLREGQFPARKKKAKPMWRHSPIVRLARGWWYRRNSSAQAQNITGTNLWLNRAKRRNSTIRHTLPDDLGRALQQYEARIEALVGFARGHGLRPIFITQPTLWDKNLGERARSLLLFGHISGVEYVCAGAGRVGIDKYNEVLLGVCERMGVECIKTESMHGQERYYYDDFHFSEAGAAELARLVAGHLIDYAGPNGSGDLL